MSRVKITGLDKAARQAKLKIGQAIKASSFEADMRSQIIEEIRENGIEPGLKASTIKARKRMALKNSTHKDYRAEDSNLTFTGQLLDGLKVKFLTARLSFIVDSLKTKHRKYKPNKGKTPTLRQIFEYQSKMGRDIGLIFNRKSFVDKLTKTLQTAIKTFYRN